MRTESYEFQSYELSDPRFGTSRSLKSTGILPDWPRGRRLGRVGECESPERNFGGTFQNCFAVISPVSQKLKSSMRAYVFRGRDASYLAPPAQIRTSPIRAYGSHLGCRPGDAGKLVGERDRQHVV